MVRPNYENSSIINIVSSITGAIGADVSAHNPLEGADLTIISKKQNVIFIIIDGLGYNFLQGQKETFISKNVIKKCTSVFPSTTATAITSFSTGLSPAQHAVTGWFVYLKELGVVSAILPFKPRYGGDPFSSAEISAEKIFKRSSIFNSIKRKSYMLTNDTIINSDYTTFYSQGSVRVAYERDNIENFFSNLTTLITNISGDKFIYCYWPSFDTLAHKKGIHSTTCSDHYYAFTEALERFSCNIGHTDSIIIATSDHGLVDSTKDEIINFDDHPALKDCLVLPLSGDPRAAYCYVKPHRSEEFESYIHKNLRDKCTLYRSRDMFEEGLFGPGEPDPRLFDRIGDYVLLPSDKYIATDSILGEKPHPYTGHHGGLSEDEMYIPLIVIEP